VTIINVLNAFVTVVRAKETTYETAPHLMRLYFGQSFQKAEQMVVADF